MTRSVRRQLMCFLVPLFTVGVAFCITEYVGELREKTPLFLFLTAVLVCTWYGGWFCGVLATILSAVVTAWIFHPGHSFVIGSHDDLIRWSMFIFIALAICSLHSSRNRAEQAFRDSQQRLSMAIDSAHVGVWDYNLLTRKLWWSKTLEVIYGCESGNFPKSYGQFFGCIHFDDQPLFNRAITRTIDEGDDYEIEHRIVLPDKSVRWVNTRGRMFFNIDSRAERIVGVVVDITARKRAEEDRGQSAQRRDERLSPVG